jgi:hypothetical protein
MSKFICLCKEKFKTKGAADLHVALHDQLHMMQGYDSHKIFQQHWQVRLLDCINAIRDFFRRHL